MLAFSPLSKCALVLFALGFGVARPLYPQHHSLSDRPLSNEPATVPSASIDGYCCTRRPPGSLVAKDVATSYQPSGRDEDGKNIDDDNDDEPSPSSNLTVDSELRTNLPVSVRARHAPEAKPCEGEPCAEIYEVNSWAEDAGDAPTPLTVSRWDTKVGHGRRNRSSGDGGREAMCVPRRE